MVKNKSRIIKRGVGILTLIYALNPAITTAQKSAVKPNVIIIYTDDQGTIDANCYGAKDLYTPNIDRLADSGVRFTQFYAAAAICSPSRAALLTGKTPLKAGLPGNAPAIRGEAGLPTEQITIAETLKKNGYKTGHIGKWHLGYSDETMPLAQGFDYSFGHMSGCIDNYSHFFYWEGANRHDLWENGKEVWMEGEYFQDVMASKAEKFITENKDQSFFLYYALNLPHYPLQASKKWREYYKNLESPRDKYAACISTLDERIGLLLDKLDELNIRENTIVIFQSDHGHSMEQRTFSGGGNSGIYRGAKFSFFEGGIRVPSIISWPSKIKKNEVVDEMAVNVDWFPSILDLCKIGYDKDDFEGKSLVDVIYKKKKTPHEVFWWYDNANRWAVRKGDWKLLKNPIDPTQKTPIETTNSFYLVNIRNNPKESENVAAKYPEKVEELNNEFNSWNKSVKK